MSNTALYVSTFTTFKHHTTTLCYHLLIYSFSKCKWSWHVFKKLSSRVTIQLLVIPIIIFTAFTISLCYTVMNALLQFCCPTKIYNALKSSWKWAEWSLLMHMLHIGKWSWSLPNLPLPCRILYSAIIKQPLFEKTASH